MLEPAVLIVVLILVMTFAWAVSVYRRRRQALARIALRMDLRFSAGDTMGLIRRLQDLYLMHIGHGRRIFNIIHGRYADYKLCAFDYTFETGAGPERATHHRSVVLWQLETPCVDLVALRSDAFDPIGRFARFQSLTIPDQGFNRRFHLYSNHPDPARHQLTAQMQTLLLRCGDIDWEITHRYFAFYSEKMLNVVELTRLVHRGAKCCRLLDQSRPNGAPANTDAPMPRPATPPH